MSKLRIGYICDQYLPRTSTDTQQIVSMISAFGLNDTDVTLVAPTKNRKKELTGKELADYYGVLETYELSKQKTSFYIFRGLDKLLFAIKLALKYKNSDTFDVIYSRNLPVVLAFLLFTKLPVVFETYRNWPDQNTGCIPFFRYMKDKKQFLGIITHSKFACNSYKNIGISADKILVSHNGIWPNRFLENHSVSGARKKLGINNKGIIATYAGRVNKDKGLEIVLELARHFPDITFWIVGSEQQGDIESDSGNIDNVTVFPWQPVQQVPLYLAASDLLIIPPSAKPLHKVGNTVLPMKTFGYMASQKPILAPRIPDIQEVITHNNNAILVKPDDFGSFKENFQKLIDDPKLRNKIAERAFNDVIDLSWEKRAQQIKKFILERMGNRESIADKTADIQQSAV